MKNIVFMLDIKLNESEGRYSASRSESYKYSIASWKKWCIKNNCELFVMSDLIFPIEKMSICWQRYYLFEILDANSIKYDQILLVDSDTIVHPETVNFFNFTKHKFTQAYFDGSWDWVIRSCENYAKHVFDGNMITWWNYFDCGFMIVNKNHIDFFNKIKSFYNENRAILIKMQETFHTGTDQTPVNFLTQINEIECSKFNYEYNMCDLYRKELLGEDLLFTKVGWIYQFNAIPNQNNYDITNHYMKKAYEHFYGGLK